MGSASQLLAENGVSIRRGRVDIHRGQAIVESFNRTLAERLFGHQQAQELLMSSGERSREWVTRLPAVVAALNNELTRLTGKKPVDAIRSKTVTSKPSAPAENPLPHDVLVLVRFLYQPGEIEGGQRRRATDAILSLKAWTLGDQT